MTKHIAFTDRESDTVCELIDLFLAQVEALGTLYNKENLPILATGISILNKLGDGRGDQWQLECNKHR